MQHGFVGESYIHIIAEQGPRSILKATLMGSAVQNTRKHRVHRQLLHYRGIIKAPAPAATARGGRRGWSKEKTSAEQFVKVSTNSGCQISNDK